jgi:hypothetical protein
MGTPRGINKVITSPASTVTVNNDGGTAIHNPYETSDWNETVSGSASDHLNALNPKAVDRGTLRNTQSTAED